MNSDTRALETRLSRDSKSGFDATPARTKQAILAEYIRQNWTQTFEGIIRTGNWLIAGRFRKIDYERYMLPFSYSWGKKLIRIALSPRILNPVNRAVMPDKADALHQISLLSDRLYEMAVSEGVINRECLVVDIKNFRRSFMQPGIASRRRLTVVLESDSDTNGSALDVLDRFVAAIQGLAESRFPHITVRSPRRMSELLRS